MAKVFFARHIVLGEKHTPPWNSGGHLG